MLPLLDERPGRARRRRVLRRAARRRRRSSSARGGLHRRRRRARLPGRARLGGHAISGLDDGADDERATRSCSPPALDGDDASPAVGCSPSPASATTSTRPACAAYARHRPASSSTACRCAATSAGGRSAPALTSYAAAGVDIDEGTRAVEQMKAAVERTHGPAVLARRRQLRRRVQRCARSRRWTSRCSWRRTDGVGTKVELAARLGRYRRRRHRHRQPLHRRRARAGRRPLFFLDYIAASKLDADAWSRRSSTGMAEACEAAGCALLGGETAEMPGVYADGAFDIAGTLVGVVDAADLLPDADVAPGDVLVGLASSGPHTNGYSLLRKLFDWLPMDAAPDRLRPHARRGAARAAPHLPAACSTPVLDDRRGRRRSPTSPAAACRRTCPACCPRARGARSQLGSWPVPPLFRAGPRDRIGLDDGRAPPHPQHGHRHGRRVRRRPSSTRSAGRDRRADLGDRLSWSHDGGANCRRCCSR